MKVNAVFLKPTKIKSEENFIGTPLILSVIAVFAGLISGTLIYCFMKDSLSSEVLRLFISFFYDFSSKTKAEILSGLIVTVLPYIFLMFVFGLDLIGAPLSLIFTFFKSLAPTLLFSFLYREYGLKGAEYVFLVLAAGEMLSLFGILLVCSSSYRMSRELQALYNGTKGEFPQEIRSFLLKFSVGTGVIILGRIVTFMTITSFSSLFEF